MIIFLPKTAISYLLSVSTIMMLHHLGTITRQVDAISSS